jgi:hypothetical protein
MAIASGEFEAKLLPVGDGDTAEGTSIGRLALDKTFSGDLVATSRGEMLSARSLEHPNSAGYVAIERVTGVLAGRQGSFVLQHTGTMDRGTPSLTISVVPDSGSGGLAGLRGTLAIEIDGGKHSYTFDYELPE